MHPIILKQYSCSAASFFYANLTEHILLEHILFDNYLKTDSDPLIFFLIRINSDRT